jgi:hypothetical protein
MDWQLLISRNCCTGWLGALVGTYVTLDGAVNVTSRSHTSNPGMRPQIAPQRSAQC